MKIPAARLDGVELIETDVYSDDRGYFLENYRSTRYSDIGISNHFIQDNLSRSKNSVLRGLHFQLKNPQAQLLTVVRGAIFDVVVDLRRNSVTFGQWLGTILSDEGPRQIYMAPGFAHGFCVLSDWADLHYKVTHEYDPDDERGLHWSDIDIGIQWPIDIPMVSCRDAAFPMLRMIGEDGLPRL